MTTARKRWAGVRIGTVTVITSKGGRLLLVRCDCGHEFKRSQAIIIRTNGECSKCTTHQAHGKFTDFTIDSAFLQNTSVEQLARMASKGSDSALVILARRVMNSDI